MLFNDASRRVFRSHDVKIAYRFDRNVVPLHVIVSKSLSHLIIYTEVPAY